MILTAQNAVEYLRSRGHLSPGESACARELSGGVSNTVIHITRLEGRGLILKQARARLNVAEPWHCSVERIWREVEVLRMCTELLRCRPTDAPLKPDVPELFFTDRENYVYGMSAAPAEHVVWKQELLSGTARSEVAQSCGLLLGTLHAQSWHADSLARQLGDRQFFDELRLDPYYRRISLVHESLAPAIHRLIDSVWRERHCLVHGDFSPKNLLVCRDSLLLIDFEVGHYGDPAFDLGFFLSHLVLKAVHHAPADGPFFDLIEEFWSRYQAQMAHVVSSAELHALIERGILNFAGCTLARLDGKSKIDYLRDAARRGYVRELCRTVFHKQPTQWVEVRQLASRLLSRVGA